MNNLGTILVAFGIVLIIIGITLNFGIIPWGRLPGDIRIVRPTTSLFVPFTTCVLISLIASLVLTLMRFFR